MKSFVRTSTLLGLAGLAIASSSTSYAGGYDTPILYSAQHMGMGGAAIAYVDDPSAMFHNPAGLLGGKGLTLMANLTLVTGVISSSPAVSNATEESEPLLALAPLAGVSYDLNDTVAFGLAFYPVASAGAEYLYKDGAGVATRNFTSVRFLEITPGVAVRLPGGVTLGAGYRVSFVSLGRYLGPEDETQNPKTFDVDMSGKNFTGFRVGLQWQPVEEFQFGVVFRSLTRTEIKADKGTIFAPNQTNITTEFTLPAKLGFGTRLNFNPIAIVLDVEYGFYSQNVSNEFLADPTLPIPVVNTSKWRDAITLRAGVEYNVEDRWSFRGGFLYDGQVSQEKYPSAFGTPPAGTTTITAGFGAKCTDNWKLDFAIAHRTGSTTVEGADSGCLPCSKDGAYKLSMTAFYVDFIYAFPNL